MTRLRATLLVLWLASLAPVTANGAADVIADPTRPSGMPQAAGRGEVSGHWHLTATHIAAGQRSAVVNGSRVREGETVGGARVLHIRHGQVQLLAQGRVTTLRLLPANVKKTR